MAATWPYPPLNPHPTAETQTTVTIGWTPIPGCGYRFNLDGVIVSHTWDETMNQTRFRRPQDGQAHSYGIEPILVGPDEKALA